MRGATSPPESSAHPALRALCRGSRGTEMSYECGWMRREGRRARGGGSGAHRRKGEKHWVVVDTSSPRVPCSISAGTECVKSSRELNRDYLFKKFGGSIDMDACAILAGLGLNVRERVKGAGTMT